MAKSKDADIQHRLERVVKDAVKNGDTISVKIARTRVENELGLGDGFFKGDAQWKGRSKGIIEAAFQEAEEPEEAAPTAKAASPVKPATTDTVKSSQKELGNKAKLRRANGAVIEKPESNIHVDTEKQVHSSQHSAPQKTAEPAAQVNGVKRKAEAESASASSTSESDGESATTADEHQQKKQKTEGSESSGEDSSGEDDPEQEGTEEERAPREPQSQHSTVATAAKIVVPISAKPFRPPAGYSALEPTSLTEDPAFSTSNLDGKQIWLITAPAMLPISSIKEFTLDALGSGDPVLTQHGIDYVLDEDPIEEGNTSTMLLPNAEGYQRTDRAVSRSLKIQPKIVLPDLSRLSTTHGSASSGAGHIAVPAVSTVPPQPKGLRMRYKPPGFGPGNPGKIGSGSESADEDDDVPVQTSFQFPRALGGHGTSTQQGPNDLADEDGQKRPKKSKKRRTDPDTSEINGVAVTAVTPVKTKDMPANGHGDSAAGDLDEKARRKEEKRLKKERKERKRAEKA